MAKIHARVTLELEIPDDEFIKIVEAHKFKHSDGSDDLNDVDLDFETLTAERFSKDGKVNYTWDDVGYIPGSWLMFDAFDSGLYDTDLYCKTNQTKIQLKEDK